MKRCNPDGELRVCALGVGSWGEVLEVRDSRPLPTLGMSAIWDHRRGVPLPRINQSIKLHRSSSSGRRTGAGECAGSLALVSRNELAAGVEELELGEELE